MVDDYYIYGKDKTVNYETVILSKEESVITITFCQGINNNAITKKFLEEMNIILSMLEMEDECKVIIMEGDSNCFCTGMDFKELMVKEVDDSTYLFASMYAKLLKQLTEIPKLIIAKIDGKVTAGGVGIAAASDLVISSFRSVFSLPEALWGLMPAIVLPFLVRRIGFQKAYAMTVTTMPADAREAYRINLIDVLTEHLDETLKQYINRIIKIHAKTIGNIKKYIRLVSDIDNEVLDRAVQITSGLIMDEEIRANINDYVTYMKFPWDKK